MRHQLIEMGAQPADARVERREASLGARLHDGAFHHGQHQRRGLARLGHARGAQARLDVAAPRREVARDELVRRGVLGIDLERQPADRAAVLTAGVDEALPVAFEQREDALEGIGRLAPGRADDVRLEQFDIRVEHRPEQVILALEEVVEAAAVGLRAHQDVGQPGRRVPPLPEEVAGGLDDAFPGVTKGGRGGGHVDLVE